MKKITLLAVSMSLMMNGCGGSGNTPSGSKDNATNSSSSNGMKLTSKDIKPGSIMDKNLSGYGTGESPQLSWSGTPTGTKGYAFIMDDLSTKLTNGTAFIHWNFFTDNISIKEIARDSSDTANISQDIIEGTNDEGKTGYSPPYPPKGTKHQYHFCIYAVNSVPTDIDAGSSFTNEAFKKKYSSIIIGNSCFDAYYTTNPTSNNNTPSNKKFRTTTPLRYMLDNYKQLDDKAIAKYLKSLNDKDKSTLSIFDSWGAYLQYHACKVDNTIILNRVTQGNVTCDKNKYNWLSTLYFVLDADRYYSSEEQWIYSTNPNIEALSQAEKDKLFSKAYSDADGLLTGIKCDTGEIDKGTCQIYFQGQQQYLNGTQQINDTRIRGIEEFTNTNYVCTYDGQILADTSVCVQQ